MIRLKAISLFPAFQLKECIHAHALEAFGLTFDLPKVERHSLDHLTKEEMKRQAVCNPPRL